jgi:hypothetical protein
MSAVIETTTQPRVLIAYVVSEDGTILPVYQPTKTLALAARSVVEPAPVSYLDLEATWEDAAWY